MILKSLNGISASNFNSDAALKSAFIQTVANITNASPNNVVIESVNMMAAVKEEILVENRRHSQSIITLGSSTTVSATVSYTISLVSVGISSSNAIGKVFLSYRYFV